MVVWPSCCRSLEKQDTMVGSMWWGKRKQVGAGVLIKDSIPGIWFPFTRQPYPEALGARNPVSQTLSLKEFKNQLGHSILTVFKNKWWLDPNYFSLKSLEAHNVAADPVLLLVGI